MRGAHAYLVESEDGLLAVDAGYTGSGRAILRFMTARGFQATDLRWVVLTHHHIDHGGGALDLCEATGARLAIHRADAAYLQPGRPRERMTGWGLFDHLPRSVGRYLVTCCDGEPRLLEDGESIGGLTVVHAPGHTPGSICLHWPKASALFAGDVLNNERGIRTPPWTVNHRHPQARTAPIRLRGLAFEQAFFGHGTTILEGADQRVAAFLHAAAPGALVGTRGGSARR